jgi:hypothetical protein
MKSPGVMARARGRGPAPGLPAGQSAPSIRFQLLRSPNLNSESSESDRDGRRRRGHRDSGWHRGSDAMSHSGAGGGLRSWL